MQSDEILIVVPARYESSRFPGKMLVSLKGKSLIQRVVDQVAKVDFPCRIVVATDDTRIFQHLHEQGIEVLMTRQEHESGTDRCAEVASMMPGYNWILNVQGDEPLIDPDALNKLVHSVKGSGFEIGTLCALITKTEELWDDSKVKLVQNKSGEVMYFSRAAIPYQRDVENRSDWLVNFPYRRHIGVYFFYRETLMRLSQLNVSHLESSERLEQLRWLENGYRIKVVNVASQHPGIDRPEDVDAILPFID